MGDQVLIQRPGPLKGHVVGGRGHGPWVIDEVTKDGKAVYVSDVFTNLPLLDRFTGLPDPIATSRLMRIEPSPVPEPTSAKVEDAMVGDVVAWAGETEVRLLRITHLRHGVSVSGQVLQVPKEERHGAWARRPWRQIPGEGEKMVQWRDLLIRVRLTEDETLVRESLDFLLNKLNARQS